METPEKRNQNNTKLGYFSQGRKNDDNEEVLSHVTKKTLSRFNEAFDTKQQPTAFS